MKALSSRHLTLTATLVALAGLTCTPTKQEPHTTLAAADTPSTAAVETTERATTPTTQPASLQQLAPSSSASTPASATAGGQPAGQLGATQQVTAAKPDPVPPLVDEAGDPLPQTDERPSLESPSFQQRMELLVEAITKDDPQLAMPAFFPRLAYAQVKAIAKPEQDWERRLITAYERNIHDHHKSLGDSGASWRLVRVELNEPRVKLMKPHTEGNSLPYYRALHSRLIVENGDGNQKQLELTSMISWRGEWYVVHLKGFK